jgi:hypothetical protein
MLKTILCINEFMQPNKGVTCPVMPTSDPAGKDFSPHPPAGGSAATRRVRLTRGWAAILHHDVVASSPRPQFIETGEYYLIFAGYLS